MNNYRITNITCKPGHTKGEFKRGFFVDVIPNGKSKPLWVNDFVDVKEITPGMLAAQKKEYISIKEITDFNVKIKEQVLVNEKKTEDTFKKATDEIIKKKEADLEVAKSSAKAAKTVVKPEAGPASSLDKDAMRKNAALGQKNKAIISGGEQSKNNDYSLGSVADGDDGVNPDGEPNFVVKATKKKSRSSGSRKTRRSK